MRNAKGFTITELIVGLGLSMLVSIFTMTTMGMFMAKQRQAQVSAVEYIDKTVAERVLLLDLRNADPSFNNMRGINDRSGLGFFDYFPDVPLSLLSDKGRSLSLTLDRSLDSRGLNEIFFLVLDMKHGVKPLIIYDPVAAYIVGPTPQDFNVAASLTYAGVDNQRFLSDQGNFWIPNQLYMLDTPARFRPVNADVTRIPPRAPIFVGLASGNDIVSSSTLSNYINMAMPWDSGARPFTSADNYLRNLPPNGGGQSVVRMKAVKLIRYYLEPMNDNRLGSNFYRQVLTSSGFGPAFLVANKVKKVDFSRRDVTSREIVFGIEKMPQR